MIYDWDGLSKIVSKMNWLKVAEDKMGIGESLNGYGKVLFVLGVIKVWIFWFDVTDILMVKVSNLLSFL